MEFADFAVDWFKFWNMVRLAVYIVLPLLVVLILGLLFWLHPKSGDRFHEWFIRVTEKYVKD